MKRFKVRIYWCDGLKWEPTRTFRVKLRAEHYARQWRKAAAVSNVEVLEIGE